MAEMTEAEKKKKREAMLEALRKNQTGVPSAQRNTEYYLPGQSAPSEVVAHRERMGAVGPAPAAPAAPGLASRIQESGVPTEGNWQKLFPEAGSYAEALKLWRAKQAAPAPGKTKSYLQGLSGQ